MPIDLDTIEPGTVLVFEQEFSTSVALLLEVNDDEVKIAGAMNESGLEPPENIREGAREFHEPDDTITDMSEEQVERTFGLTYEDYENSEDIN